MDFGLSGNIEKFTLPEIFQLVASSRKSGTLGIQRDDSIIMIYFKDGKIIYAYGPRQTFHLGQLLREKNKISERQLEQAIAVQAKIQNSKRLGEIMISRRFIDRVDLNNVVQTQIEELLFTLMSWNSGTFKFYEEQFPTDEEITVEISVENVILEGLRRLDEQNMIKEALPDLDEVYVISAAQSDRTRDISLQAKEWNIMALVDGYRSINEIISFGSVDRESSLNKLAQLKLAGIITKAGKQKKELKTDKNLDQMVNRLAGLFENYLTQKKTDRITGHSITEDIGEPTLDGDQ
jgi:hypothetical protein